MLFYQIIPPFPSPTESKSLFFMSMSSLLPYIESLVESLVPWRIVVPCPKYIIHSLEWLVELVPLWKFPYLLPTTFSVTVEYDWNNSNNRAEPPFIDNQ